MKREKAALITLNQSLAGRLKDANAEISRLALQYQTWMRRPLTAGNANDDPSISWATRGLRSERRIRAPLPNQDNDEDSDTPTEVQHVASAPRFGSAARSEGLPDLRTRTIVYELTRELEASRLRSDQSAYDSEEQASLLEARVRSRELELERAYGQLDELYEVGLQHVPVKAPVQSTPDMQDVR